MDEWYNLCRKTYFDNELKLGTIIGYDFNWNFYLKPYIGDIKVADLLQIDIQTMIDDMLKKYSAGTIKTVLNPLRKILKYAEINRVIMITPCRNLKYIRKNKGVSDKSLRILSDEEIELFFKTRSKNNTKELVYFALNTGLRIGEMLGLTWGDIDFENRTINVYKQLRYVSTSNLWMLETPKTLSSIRKVPMTKELYEFLKKKKEHDKPIAYSGFQNQTELDIKEMNLVFRTSNETPMFCRNVDGALGKFCESNNLNKCSVHDLRHTFATKCIESGMNPKTLQYILGHKEYSTTMNLYVHCRETTKTNEIQLLNYKFNWGGC